MDRLNIKVPFLPLVDQCSRNVGRMYVPFCSFHETIFLLHYEAIRRKSRSRRRKWRVSYKLRSYFSSCVDQNSQSFENI